MQENQPKQKDKFLFKTKVETRRPPLPASLSESSLGYMGGIRYRLEYRREQIRGWAEKCLYHEIEAGILFNMIPVMMAVGILLYFVAPREPLFTALFVSAILPFAIATKARFYSSAFFISSSIAVVFLGMITAKTATFLKGTPTLERQITSVVSGGVVEVDLNRRGFPRLLIEVHEIDGLEKHKTPKRIRLSAAKGAELIRPGDEITGLARMQPFSGPAHPGSYDFFFHAWFRGIGGTGFFMGPPKEVTNYKEMSLRSSFQIEINKVRSLISERISPILPGATGHIAVALITGDKSGIDETTQDVLRKTGLAHILAISGLHMALVTLTVIWLIRFLLAQSKYLALNKPIKKWSVWAGFVSATVYLFLSGGGIATQRAWVMISIMLFAVLMDRKAVTMRSVAVSAIIILLVSPESLLSPGFQMSFAAVVSLVAGYEWLTEGRHRKTSFGVLLGEGGVARSIRKSGAYFGGLATTSLIAGTATAFISAWHFNQIAPLGLVANLLVMPIVGIAVMPLVALSVLLMPFGFEAVSLPFLSIGIDAVLSVARWVNQYSPSGIIGQSHILSLLIFSSGLAILTLFKTPLRYVSIILFFLLPFIWTEGERPDVLISENGRSVALIDDDGLALVYPRRSKFTSDIWAKAWTEGKTTSLKTEPDQCTKERCIVVLKNSRTMHLVYNPDLIASSCLRADILVAPRLWWIRCKTRVPELLLSRQDFEAGGSHALYFEKTDYKNSKNKLIEIKTAINEEHRPWSRSLTPIEEHFERIKRQTKNRNQQHQN